MARNPDIDQFQRRAMHPQTIDGITCLDVVRWTAGKVAPYRAFFASGTSFDLFDPETRMPEDAAVEDVRGVMGGLMFSGTALDTDAPLRLRLKDGAIELEATPPEHNLLAGMNVGLTINNGMPVEAIVDWIRYHVEHHGMTGVLLVNRVWPDSKPDQFAKKLQNAVKKINGLIRLVLLDVDFPLGRTDMAREDHPFVAPDAPGKDRMEIPPNDPFRSPLGEALIYEIVKWRFLASADAVLTIDPYDIIAPCNGAPTVFDTAIASNEGMVLLEGHRIFPWRVRSQHRVSFGDHICRRFDDTNRNKKWCVVPEKAGLENVWRMIRIANVTPDAEKTQMFYRCMGIRYPDKNVSEIVPKTSLIEDDTLVDMAKTIFKSKPVRQPQSKLNVKKPKAVDGGYTAIVTTMKNEGPFILEWLAYHRAIGVKGFLVYTNDCTDGTDDMLDLLQEKGFLQHRDNPFKQTDLKPQHAALQAAEEEDIITKAGWAICMDVDEFINIHVGNGTLADLYGAVGDANMVSITWRLFGNSDIHEFDPDFMLRQFTACAPQLIRKPHQAWGFKTLFRNIGIYKKMGVHRPKGLKPDLYDQIIWVNGSGKRMPTEMLRNGWRSTADTFGYDLVSLNHYAVRSAESFLVKRDRGRVNHVDRDQGMNYWFRMNHNAEHDHSIQRMIPAMQAEFEKLMADPDIAAIHNMCIDRHRAKIDELKATENYAKFYAELTGERCEKLSKKLKHFGSNVFMKGPEVIPDEIAVADLPPNFFFTVPK